MPEQGVIGERLRAVSVEAAKLVGAATFSTLFFAPYAVEHAVEHTTVDTQVADFPATLSFQPNISQLDLDNQTNIYVKKTVAGVGIHAAVGLPRIDSNQRAEDLLSPKFLDVMGSMADSTKEAVAGPKQQLKREAIRQAEDFMLLWGSLGTAVIYGGASITQLRRKVAALEGRETVGLSGLGLGGLAAMAIAGSFAVADHQHQAWVDASPAPQPDRLVTIHSLDSTSLAGAKMDNPWLLGKLDQGITYASKLKDRRIQQREQYLATAEPQLKAQLLALPDLRKDEELFFVMTDMHSSKAGITLAKTSIQTLQTRFGDKALQDVFNIGDSSYAAAFQRQSVLSQVLKPLPVSVYITRGNHDVGPVPGWIKESGMHDVKGYVDAHGLSAYGQPDPLHTPFLSDSSYVGPTQNETTLGQQAAADLAKKPADLLNLHEPTALGAAVGLDNIGGYLQSSEDEALTTCDYGAGSITDVPFILANSGHWHDQYPLKVVCNPDGTWGVINVQGTGGGANEAPTINDWSDPDGKPVKTVSFRAFIRNTKYNSITGAVDIQIRPDGTVLPIHRVDIGTTDGSPFPSKSLIFTQRHQPAKAKAQAERAPAANADNR